jgi:copper(I)-binding protein
MHRTLHTRPVLGVLSVVTGMLLLMGCQTDPSPDQQAGPPPLPDGELEIEDPWVRPAPAGSTTVLSMKIANGRQDADTLLRARAPIIDSSDVRHAAGEIASTLAIPGSTRVSLAPDTTHVRLLNLGQSFDENSSLVLNLEFARSGLQRIQVPVRTTAPSQQ